MDNDILSVTIDELIQKTWKMVNENGENIEELVEIFNELTSCRQEIDTFETEQEYIRIEKRVRNCDYKIMKMKTK